MATAGETVEELEERYRRKPGAVEKTSMLCNVYLCNLCFSFVAM
jgi:hypothetical protein